MEGQQVCKHCGRPVREECHPPFMEEAIGYYAVYHDDGGDILDCNPDDPNSTEAAL